MKIMDKIIVLMSTYNGEKYLRQQIDSILNQKECVVDLIVRDDGSNDNTVKILEEYESRNQLSWYSGKNLGAAKSFYDLFLRASDCQYYAFADQDDIWDEDKLYIAIEALKVHESRAALYYSNARIMDDTGNDIGINTYKVNQKLNFEGFVCCGGAIGCTMVINSELRKIALIGGMPNKIIMHDDYLTSLCFTMGGYVIYDHHSHMSYRQHNNNVIGIPMNFKQAVQARYRTFIKPVKISIADQTWDIMERFNNLISKENIEFLQVVTNYRNSILSRVKLAFHPKTKYVSWKSSIYIRLGILCGKR